MNGGSLNREKGRTLENYGWQKQNRPVIGAVFLAQSYEETTNPIKGRFAAAQRS